jgi:hypothetical protein
MPLTYAPVGELPVTVGDDEDVQISDSEGGSDCDGKVIARPMQQHGTSARVAGRRWGPVCSQTDLNIIDELWGAPGELWNAPYSSVQADTDAQQAKQPAASWQTSTQGEDAAMQSARQANAFAVASCCSDAAGDTLQGDSDCTSECSESDVSDATASAPESSSGQPAKSPGKCADCTVTLTKNWFRYATLLPTLFIHGACLVGPALFGLSDYICSALQFCFLRPSLCLRRLRLPGDPSCAGVVPVGVLHMWTAGHSTCRTTNVARPFRHLCFFRTVATVHNALRLCAGWMCC